MSTNIQKNQITEGIIWRQLLLFFFPILLGTFFQQLYNTIDSVIVGQFVGKEALAAVGGSSAQIVAFVVGFFTGLSSGASVTIAQFFGAKDSRSANKGLHTAYAIAAFGGLILTVSGIILTPFLLEMMNTPADIVADSAVYLRIYFAGIIFVLIYNMGSAILRATGDSKRPLYYLMASCLTNIVLDLALVVGLKMDVRGAAIATIASQLVSAVLITRRLLKTEDTYKLVIKKIRLNLYMVMRIVRIGLPAGLQSVMYSASNIIIQSSVNSLGTDTVAAWTAYSKIDSVYWMIISALGISVTTFVGQNYGAGKMDRVKRGIYVCLGLSFLITILLSVSLYLGGGYIYLMFTTDAAVIEKGMQILHFLVPTFVTYVCIEILSGSLRGTGDCWIPMIMTALGVCALRVIWILIAVPISPNIMTVIFSYPLTWSITSILFLIYFYCFSSLKKFNVKLPGLRRKRRRRA